MQIDVYGRMNPPCSFCIKARALIEREADWFTNRFITVNYFGIGADITLEELKEVAPNAKTVPVVMIDGQHIGGFVELESLVTQMKEWD